MKIFTLIRMIEYPNENENALDRKTYVLFFTELTFAINNDDVIDVDEE